MIKKHEFPDKNQLEIINDTSHVLKVIAGPGAGKTSTLVEKLTRLIDIKNPNRINPNKILFITFTKNSAKDIKKKLLKELKKENSRLTLEDINDLYVSTFHGFCNILREEYKEFFLDYGNAKILDEEQSFIKISDTTFRIKNEVEENLDADKIDNELRELWKNEPEEDWLKSENFEIEGEFESDLHPKNTKKVLDALSVIQENYRDIFTSDKDFNEEELQLMGYYLGYYGAMRHNEEELDFGMLIRIVVEKLRNEKYFREIVSKKFDYIFVDEFQDTNKIQEELLGLISGNAKIIVVGDDWQSIYGFRGSNKEIFNNFPSENILQLPINYRSKSNLVTIANAISNQENIMKSYSSEGGNKVIIKEFSDASSENKEIFNFIKNLPKNIKYSDIAILTTSLRSYGSKKNPIINLVELLKSQKIPLKITGEGNLINHDYIGEIIHLFKYIADGNGLIDKPKLKVLSLKFIPEIYKENQEKERKSILELLYSLLKDSKFFIDAVKNNEREVLKNIGTLSKIINDYEEYSAVRSLRSFIKYFEFRLKYFDGSNDADENSINIMTLHKAKGLEFKVVIIPYITDKRYPRGEKYDFKNFLPKFNPQAENKRSFYVGITRAKELLHLSFHMRPSKYIKPILNSSNFVNFTQFKGNQTLTDFFGEKDEKKIIIDESKDANVEDELIALSFGKIIEFLNCPLKYHFKFNYELKLPKSRYYGYGLYMHNLLKEYNWSKILREKIIPEELIIEEEIPKPGTKKTVENQFKQYIKKYEKDLDNIIALEKSFKIIFSGMQITGRADLILRRNNKVVIVDFKSGEEDEGKIRLAKTQLCLYALCLPKEKIEMGEIYFLKDGKRETFRISKKDKEDMKELLLHLKRYLKSEKISCNNQSKSKNYHCLKCEVGEYNICPFKKIEKESLSNDSREDNDLNIILEFEPDYCF
jgi:DNA helicase II / ATP-dependent DNA helicase PcrA